MSAKDIAEHAVRTQASGRMTRAADRAHSVERLLETARASLDLASEAVGRHRLPADPQAWQRGQLTTARRMLEVCQAELERMKAEIADSLGIIATLAEAAGALCEACSVEGHDICALVTGCRCCADTLTGLMRPGS